IVQSVDEVADIVGHVAAMQPLAAAVAWIDDFLEIIGGGDDFVVVGEWAVAEVIDRTDLFVSADDAIGEFRQLVFESEIGSHLSGLLVGWSPGSVDRASRLRRTRIVRMNMCETYEAGER